MWKEEGFNLILDTLAFLSMFTYKKCFKYFIMQCFHLFCSLSPVCNAAAFSLRLRQSNHAMSQALTNTFIIWKEGKQTATSNTTVWMWHTGRNDRDQTTTSQSLHECHTREIIITSFFVTHWKVNKPKQIATNNFTNTHTHILSTKNEIYWN